MGERHSLERLAREPLYNTRAVTLATGVPTETFRAWERRYGLPRPYRTAANQRLYSEQDIGVISWLRDRTNEGMTISQAIQRLRLECPGVCVADRPAGSRLPAVEPDAEPRSARLRRRLLDAFGEFDSHAADHVIDEALACFTIEEFCVRLVEPALQESDVRWSQRDLDIAVERFATRLLTRRLSALFTIVSRVTGCGTIVVAGPPGEPHEAGLLVLAIMLSRRGWRVVYLGANVPPGALVEAARAIRPDLVCLSVRGDRVGAHATMIGQTFATEVDRPLVVVCGRTFASGELSRMESGAHVVSGTAVEVVEQIADLVERQSGELQDDCS